MNTRTPFMRNHRNALFPTLVLVVFFFIPFLIMFSVSFFARNESGFYQPGFELSNYARFMSAFFGNVLLTSIGISAVAALISVSIALPFTFLVTKMSATKQAIVLVFLLSVLSLSEVIVGFAWSTLLSETAGVGKFLAAIGLLAKSRSFAPSLGALLLGLTYLGLPYAVLVIYPALSRLDPEIPEAARMLGASPIRSFFNVILPMLRNTITGALTLVFVFTLGAYLLPQLLGGPQHWTLSVHITDQAIFQSNLPFAAAMAIFLMIVSLALVGFATLLGKEKV